MSDTSVERFVDDITGIYHTLSRTDDLRPSKIVNELFGKLVSLCTQTLSSSATKQILQNKQIQNLTPSLHHLCATAECYLESHWAAQILGTDAPEDEDGVLRLLRAFPYYENYVDLTQMELSALHAVKPLPPKKIAFIGSGPLPLTSICLCQALDKVNGGQGSTTVLNIDKNPEAVKQSRALAERLGISARGMQFSCEVAGSANLDLRGFDAVYLAALVGTTQEEKERVLIEIVKGMTVGSLLVIRTGHGLRSLLYPEFDATTKAVLACLVICLVVHPYEHVVNSVIVGRVKPRARSGTKL